MSGHSLEHRCGRLLRADALRDLDQAPGGDRTEFGV